MSQSEEAKPTVEVIRAGGELRLRSRTLRLEIVDGPDRGNLHRLPGPEVTIGSSPACHLPLSDPTVSRLHTTLRLDKHGIRVVDGGSRNGTILDGLRVRDAYARSDSLLTLGTSVIRLAMAADTVDLPLSSRESFGGLIGTSVGMRRLFTLLERIAPTDATVLVRGETGTGKELVAEALHEASTRATEAFVVFDCSAVSPTLIESELFGHVKGAFTGAVASRRGAFEAAQGGTIFLDEIGELPLELQPKLLRALERREIRPVGCNDPVQVDVRVVAATNRPLAQEVDAGRFREDLYFRLAVVEVEIPPLRERPEDIAPLAQHFARQLVAAARDFVVPEATLRNYMAQRWPGNARELRNAIARLVSLGEPTLDTLPPSRVEVGEHGASFDVDLSIPLATARDRLAEVVERAYIEAALRQSGHNVTRAAELAGVSRKFVQRAMKRFGLREPR